MPSTLNVFRCWCHFVFCFLFCFVSFHCILITLQEGKPVRLKAFHVIYSAKIVERVMNVMKPFMKSELQKMVSFLFLYFK